MKKIKIHKKHLIVISSACFAGTVFLLIIFAYRPLAIKTGALRSELQVIVKELNEARAVIAGKDKLWRTGHLITRKGISLAIDEMTKSGKALNINIISISPQEAEKLKDSNFQRLPIEMDIESEYKDLGLFLGALGKLNESIVTVRSFQVVREAAILPRIRTQLIVDMYLQDGTGG